MNAYIKEELEDALQIVSSVIRRCEKAQTKFVEGTSQHSLLQNRIKALYISKTLLTNENEMDKYTKAELTEAIRPISSIISKCEKAQNKLTVGSFHYNRFKNMIKAMIISKEFITEEINQKQNCGL